MYVKILFSIDAEMTAPCVNKNLRYIARVKSAVEKTTMR